MSQTIQSPFKPYFAPQPVKEKTPLFVPYKNEQEYAKAQAKKEYTNLFGSSKTTGSGSAVPNNLNQNQLAVQDQMAAEIRKQREDEEARQRSYMDEQIKAEEAGMAEDERRYGEQKKQTESLFGVKKDETNADYDDAATKLENTRERRKGEFADASQDITQNKEQDLEQQTNLFGRLGIAQSSQFIDKDNELRTKYADLQGKLSREEQQTYTELDSEATSLEKGRANALARLNLELTVQLENINQRSFDSQEARLAAIRGARQSFSQRVSEINNQVSMALLEVQNNKAKLLDEVERIKAVGQGKADKVKLDAAGLTAEQSALLDQVASSYQGSVVLDDQMRALLATYGLDEESDVYKRYALSNQALTGVSGTFEDFVGQQVKTRKPVSPTNPNKEDSSALKTLADQLGISVETPAK
jgi:hypothetical protein